MARAAAGGSTSTAMLPLGRETDDPHGFFPQLVAVEIAARHPARLGGVAARWRWVNPASCSAPASGMKKEPNIRT